MSHRRTAALLFASASFLSAFFAGVSLAADRDSSSDTRLNPRGDRPDMTARERYDTAIREAGGGYKEYLKECAAMNEPDRASCRKDAKARYDADMAAAKALLRP